MFLESWNCHGKVENIARKYSWLQFIYFNYVINFCNISPNHKKIVQWKITRFCTVWLYLLQNSKLNRLPLSPVFPVAHCKVVLPTVMGTVLCVHITLCVRVCVFACSVSVSYSTNIEMNILSFQRNFRYWLYRRLSFRKLSVQLVMKISSMCVVALNGQ